MFKLTILVFAALLIGVHCRASVHAGEAFPFAEDEDRGIIDDIIGSLTGLVKAAVSLLNQLVRSLNINNALLDVVLSPLKNLLGNVNPIKFVDHILSLLQITGPALEVVIGTIIDPIQELLLDPTKIIIEALESLQTYIQNLLKNGIAIGTGQDGLISILNSIIAQFTKTLDLATSILDGFLNNLSNLMRLPKELFSVLTNAIQNLLNTVTGLIERVVGILKSILSTLTGRDSPLRKQIEDILALIREIANNLLESITASISKLIEEVSSLNTQLKELKENALKSSDEIEARNAKLLVDDILDQIGKLDIVINMLKTIQTVLIKILKSLLV